MIPKTIHHVWVGGLDMPEDEKRWIATWKNAHPSWDFMLWSDDNISKLKMPENCLEAYNNLEGLYALQADIVRYNAVCRYGGVYVDTDMECLRPIDEVFSDNLSFVGLRPHKGNWICNGFFGATQKHPILLNAIDFIKSPARAVLRKKNRNIWGPVYLTRHYMKHAKLRAGDCIESANSKSFHILSPLFWTKRNPKAYCKHYARASWRRR